MPIHGIGNRVPIVGYIKIGEKGEKRTSKDGNDWYKPKWIGYFKITTLERDKSTNLVTDQAVMAKLPEKPTRIEGAILIGETVDDVMDYWYKYHPGKRLACQGDNRQATKFHEDGTQESIPCPCPLLNKEGGCTPSARLYVMLPELAGMGGVYALTTHGITSIDAIVGALKWEYHLREKNQSLPDHAKGLMGLGCTLTHVMERSTAGFPYPKVILTITGKPGKELGGFDEPLQIEELSSEAAEAELEDEHDEFTDSETQEAEANGGHPAFEGPGEVGEGFLRGIDETTPEDIAASQASVRSQAAQSKTAGGGNGQGGQESLY